MGFMTPMEEGGRVHAGRWDAWGRGEMVPWREMRWRIMWWVKGGRGSPALPICWRLEEGSFDFEKWVEEEGFVDDDGEETEE